MPKKKTKDQEIFSSDAYETAENKNNALAALLEGPWNPLEIVKIERVEKETTRGWRATYRE